MFNVVGIEYNKCRRTSSERQRKKYIQSDILLVDEDLAWHHSSAGTALWSGGFDVQLYAEVYVETKNITSRVDTYYLPLAIYQGEYSDYRYRK